MEFRFRANRVGRLCLALVPGGEVEAMAELERWITIEGDGLARARLEGRQIERSRLVVNREHVNQDRAPACPLRKSPRNTRYLTSLGVRSCERNQWRHTRRANGHSE